MVGPGKSSRDSEEPPRSFPGWCWGLLALAVLWSLIARIPLIVNATTHLDSDLAVDGLTLLDATRGQIRWHYPGTPHIGAPALLLGLPFGLIAGATPFGLALGGTFLNALAIVATFWLALRVHGPRVAAWSLVPLAFASTGLIWLSGRITGGHLLAVAWHAGAFALLYATLSRPSWRRAVALGLWCGLGLWNDSLFVMTLAGLVPAGLAAWWAGGRPRRGLGTGLVILAGLGLGLVPKAIGGRVDPYDAYHEQFAPIWNPEVLLDHARILGLDCLPRLIVGHRLPGLEAEPGGIGPDGQAMPASRGGGLLATATVATGLSLFLLVIAGEVFRPRLDPDRARRAVGRGLMLTSVAVIVAFIVNRNIYNSDNYRYLVLLVVPWAVGFGRLMDGLARRGRGGAVFAGVIGLTFALVFTRDAGAWYRRLGWLDDRGAPVARPIDDPVLAWLDAHREVTHLYGGYWDVYRLSFLTGGRVAGVPSGHYPNRFPEIAAGLPGGHPRVLLARGTPVGAEIYRRAVREGGTELFRGAGAVIVSWP